MADEAPCALDVERTATGVRMLAPRPDGETADTFDMDRAAARDLAHKLLAAAGDGAERTFGGEAAHVG